jgi:chaperonin cofactor prefoldin
VVLQELQQAVEEGHHVYKLVGGILLKQETNDSVLNVVKRIDFIKAEM